jgi:hypothetical protein
MLKLYTCFGRRTTLTSRRRFSLTVSSDNVSPLLQNRYQSLTRCTTRRKSNISDKLISYFSDSICISALVHEEFASPSPSKKVYFELQVTNSLLLRNSKFRHRQHKSSLFEYTLSYSNLLCVTIISPRYASIEYNKLCCSSDLFKEDFQANLLRHLLFP